MYKDESIVCQDEIDKPSSMSFKLLTLANWQFRQVGEKEWTLSVPNASSTQIHADLLHNGKIPDPFIDVNEKSIQWVGEADWEYQVEFFVEMELGKLKNQVLVFEGLDTFATVYLNDKEILKTENMFCEDRVEVKSILNYGANNKLLIRFDSALLIARSLEKKKGKFVCWNGETCRLHIRKAPYHFGWDWGPVIMTCGPYKPVRLESFDTSIEDFHVHVDVTDKKDVHLEMNLKVNTQDPVSATIEIISHEGVPLATEKLSDLKSGTYQSKVSLSRPELWYPHTVGKPALHRFKVQLFNGSKVVYQLEEEIGLRKIELVQEPLERGTSFYFRVNGIPVYCAGSNWIPAHSLLTQLTHEDYTDWLSLAVNGNQAMIRVWGGGYYEDDFFYSECDRLGLLVWQDFMFACGQYPADEEFIANVSREVDHQLHRLRNHACLAVFAGNNEDYQIAEVADLDWDPNDTSGDYSNTNFPARVIYEKTLPDLMKKYLPTVPYHPGSPWSGTKPTTDPTVGDLHQWNVWHGSQEKYQDWYKLGGRFVSEFGMEALPSIKTYKACITDPKQLYPQSEYVDHHNKADGFERRLALYVIENIKITSFDLDSWIYATQLIQAECLAYAYKCWRRNWKNDKQRDAGGALVWQINDCWPVASWAIVDFYRRPKLAYYAIKRESAPVALGMYRNIIGGPSEDRVGAPHDYRRVKHTLDVWGVNSSLKDAEGELTVIIYDATTGEKLETVYSEKAVLNANGSTEAASALKVPEVPCVAYARFVASDGQLIASASDWPQPLKYLDLSGRTVNYEVSDGSITLSTDKPVKGVEIVLDLDLFLEDNGFDLFPEDTKVVQIDGLKAGDHVSIRYYQK